jgi:hypothetical protein|tara:strand:- start:289 stop:591 length:303 start_codon:yes stop_codon:yes gene_type:complete
MQTQTLEIKITDQNYFDSFLKTLEDNTFKNYHTENCMLIAVNFGTEIQKEEMKEVFNDHNDEKYNYGIKCMTSIARKYLIKDILENIKDKKLAKKIKARL